MSGFDSSDGLADLCRDVLALPGKAVHFEGRWLDWREIRSLSAAVDHCLAQTTLPGDRIAFAPRNHPASLAAFLPLLARGHPIAMLYPFQSAGALAHTLEGVDCRAAVLDARDAAPVVLDTLRRRGIACIAIGPNGAAIACEGSVRGLAGNPSSTRHPTIDVLTSGTTGPPEPFPIPYRVVRGFIAEAEVRQRGDGPPPLLFFPLSNISGLYSTAQSFLRGKPVVLLERFRLSDWHEYVRTYRPTVGGVPPAAIGMILAADIPPADLASIRFMATGAAPVDDGTAAAFRHRYGIPILQSYGATEFAGPVATMTADHLAEFGPGKAASVGRAMAGAQLRIVSPEDGRILPPGEIGVVEVVSPRLGPGWVRTADLGYLDADGFLYLSGRLDGAIMRGGFKVIPEIVEQALLTHPDVREASVVGLRDQRLFQIPAAAIVSKAPLDADALGAHLRQRLSAPQIPARWLFVEELPRTVSFKVDRRAVEALFADPDAAS